MKKIALLVIVMVFMIGTLVSCNQSICPAYVDNPGTQTQQPVQNNS